MVEVEQFLTEHQQAYDDEAELEQEEAFEEAEVAEALAVTWRDKRKELNRLQKERKFRQAGEVRRSFQVEASELKKRTKCHRCQQVGHWARECHLPPPAKGKGKGKSKQPPTGAASVERVVQPVEHVSEFFMAPVTSMWPTLQRLREQRGLNVDVVEPSLTFDHQGMVKELILVSSPGYGVLDSGCGRSIIGERTLQSFEQLWKERQQPVPPRLSEKNLFKYGNGEQEVSQWVVQVPVKLGGRSGSIRAAVVRGDAPLLISRAALQKLQAVIDFSDSSMKVFPEQIKIPLSTNEAGQYVVRLLDDDSVAQTTATDFQEVMLADEQVQPTPNPEVVDEPPTSSPAGEVPDSGSSTVHAPAVDEHLSPQTHTGRSEPLQVWCRDDSFVVQVPKIGKQGPFWNTVICRRVIDRDTGTVLLDEPILPQKGKGHYSRTIPPHVLHIRTEFTFRPEESHSCTF